MSQNHRIRKLSTGRSLLQVVLLFHCNLRSAPLQNFKGTSSSEASSELSNKVACDMMTLSVVVYMDRMSPCDP